MTLSHIVAISKNRVIGKDNKLPWHIPEDLKFFREKTKDHILIMGRKTFDSLGGPLPKRLHIVISRQHRNSDNPRVIYVNSLQDALSEARKAGPQWPKEIFIAGGGEIYSQSLSVTDKIYMTVIDQTIEGDTFYPEINMAEFDLVDRADRDAPVKFSFQTFARKSNPIT